MKKVLDGVMIGTGIVAVLAVAIVIAWAGDVFTVDKDGIPKFAVSDAGKITVGATESYVNLVIQNNSGAATNKVDITADVLTVEGIRLESVNVSADITAAGAGGLDAGSEAANTWYYVWAITNNDGTTTNGMLSVSSTSPTMPSGYTKKRRVGAVRNNASSDFPPFVQIGNKVIYGGPASNNIIANGDATSYTNVSAASFIPPTANVGSFLLDVGLSYTSAATVFAYYARNPNTNDGGNLLIVRSQVAGVITSNTYVVDIKTDASRNVAYRRISATAPSAGGMNINVVGYYDRI
ncbi:MAG: hypothetical protein A2Z34_11565 [Planctomycetes bacterium RBG_16_59_8]|nr:MAG: hypothetical protein A2Z34_11565 [Planctomycetes bacterium RBG_16_59_8]